MKATNRRINTGMDLGTWLCANVSQYPNEIKHRMDFGLVHKVTFGRTTIKVSMYFGIHHYNMQFRGKHKKRGKIIRTVLCCIE